MTATTADQPTRIGPARRPGLRFVVAFLAGLIAALAVGAGALYGYDRQFEGRVLPGVRVGSVDVSGLSPAAARDRVAAAYAHVVDGTLTLSAGDRTFSILWSDLDRRVDVDGLVADALAVGRTGGPVERAIGNARTAIRGVVLEPAVLFDGAALATAIERAAARLDRTPRDASVSVTAEGMTLKAGTDGAAADRRAPIAAATAALARLDAPADVRVEIPVAAVEPWITTAEAEAGMAAAQRIAKDIDVTVGDEAWTIKASTVRTWLRVTPTVDGEIVPVLDVTKVPATIERIAEKVQRAPRNASFTIGGNNAIEGVVPSVDGRRMDVAATSRALSEVLIARAETPVAAVPGAVTALEPSLTTAEAEAAAPKMTRISTWTTYFPISEKNGNGANIWIPAEDIDGYVVGPGEWFDFWKAVGPVTRERGYKDGGAIINGRTEPQGALAGGICSCSTTLFNAALRAGFEMGDRRNHYYYIDRYPIGLDATVFKSGSGSVQTMSWRNDTQFPVLVRGHRIREGNDGYVRFDLYSVPNGRTVSLSRPTIKNVRQATDSVERTSSLPAGQSKRIEYPVDGKDVWVTRTVRDANGQIVHQETYYSHYATITGVVLVGTG